MKTKWLDDFVTKNLSDDNIERVANQIKPENQTVTAKFFDARTHTYTVKKQNRRGWCFLKFLTDGNRAAASRYRFFLRKKPRDTA